MSQYSPPLLFLLFGRLISTSGEFLFFQNLTQDHCFWKTFSDVIRLPSVQFSHSVVSDSLQPHESQHTRPPCPSPTPGVHSDSCPESVMPSSHLILCRSLLLLPPIPPNIRVFSNESTLRMRWPSTGVSTLASVLPMNTQDWSPLEWTGWISLQSKGLSRVFSNTTVEKYQFFSAQLSSQSNSHIHTWPLEKP